MKILLACLCLLCGPAFATGDAADSAWVTVGPDGKLIYKTTEKGDRIMDFSYAGYGGGGVKLPTVSVQKEIDPSGGEDAPAIQAALDSVAALPLVDGFRGAVLLHAGSFHCSQPLVIAQDGVVLRGAGSGADKSGTTIEMTGDAHVCIELKGTVEKLPNEEPTAYPITDAYVPSGTSTLSLKEASGLAAGDSIRISWHRTKAWIHMLGMDALVRDGKPQTWLGEGSGVDYFRTISAIDGNKITLDIPLPEAIDAELLAPETAVVSKATWAKRMIHSGVESLRIDAPLSTGILTAPHYKAISFDGCEDCWANDIFSNEALGLVEVTKTVRRITLEKIQSVHTSTVERGAGSAGDFGIRGSQILIDRCSVKYINCGGFYVDTAFSNSCLNVILNCTFEGTGAIQPHQRWSTTMLTDSCSLPDGGIDYINRATAGSGHGWSMAWGVVWNCQAKRLDIQQPPNSVNWCIGCTGELALKKVPKGEPPAPPPSGPWLSSVGTPVNPKSLYLAQLRERLGDQAVSNIGY
jgi:hypothetical protein